MKPPPVLIAQITDCHIGFDPVDPEEMNVQRLRAVLARIAAAPQRPDLLLLTGDLTSAGSADSYARLARELDACPLPARLLAGNWDERSALLGQFPGAEADGGFIQFEVALPGFRVLALDTTQPGRHSGAFCEARADWLAAKLAADRVTPVLIAMHHPPILSGIDWMDGSGDEDWIVRFEAAIAGHGQVRSIVCGHLHRTLHTSFGGVPLSVCPSTAPAVALDLSGHDPAYPDGRAMVLAEPPGYALHRWDGARLVSHFESVAEGQGWPVLARFDAAMLRTVEINARERGD